MTHAFGKLRPIFSRSFKFRAAKIISDTPMPVHMLPTSTQPVSDPALSDFMPSKNKVISSEPAW